MVKTFGVYNTFWIAIDRVSYFLLYPVKDDVQGRHIYAVGSNVDAAKLSGVDVVTTTIKRICSQRDLLLHCWPDPLCTGWYGKYGSGKYV